MAEKRQFQAIKGVRDILPPESALWNRVEQTAREVFGTFGFAEIRLPIFEDTELFARSVGQETDIVSKEMYTFVDRPLELPAKPTMGEIPGYIEAIGHLMHSGAIPKSQANVERLKFLTDEIKELYPLFEKSVERYADRLLVLSYAIEDFQLGPEISLRPEATASVVRAYTEHGMQTLPGNVKLYYMGPMFRRERPQKGRYRQFYQIGAEVLGSSDAPGIDAEVIEMLLAFFERLKLKGAVLHINSIGDKNCRPAYVERLHAELQKVREQLGADSQRRIETNPLRVLDSKLEHEQAIIEKLPRIADHLCAECRAHYDEVKRQLALRGIAYQENWRLVRGLDYYMRTTFEITAPGLGSQNAVCGGGRYDGLVELLGGPATTKGIGFAIGTDRLVLSLQESGVGEVSGGPARPAGGLDVYLAWFGAAAQTAAVGLARRLRDAGFVVELPAVEMKFGKSLGLADRLKARHAVILGEDELAAGVVAVKRLADGTQQKLAEQDLFSHLRAARDF
ncbi:MAG TPA: histidine--tRNA ligase [Candidatus Dormibacteraeota bacterium]|nr:histidine--tRNA ligase [Candidatus Dormibacteraeota bacterium]